jgi:hypothetical protein
MSVSVAVGIAIGGTIGAVTAHNLGYDIDDWQFWAITAGGAAIGYFGGAWLASRGLGAAPYHPSKLIFAMAGILAVIAIYDAYSVTRPSGAKQNKIDQALELIRTTPGFESDYNLLTSGDFTINTASYDLIGSKWAYVRPWQNDSITLMDSSGTDSVFDLPTPLLAAVLVHELVHTQQNIPLSFRMNAREIDAYARQSDFMHAIGYFGTRGQILARASMDFPPGSSEYDSGVTARWLTDQRAGFVEGNTANPAVAN